MQKVLLGILQLIRSANVGQIVRCRTAMTAAQEQGAYLGPHVAFALQNSDCGLSD